jgi:hypothetical protein
MHYPCHARGDADMDVRRGECVITWPHHYFDATHPIMQGPGTSDLVALLTLPWAVSVPERAHAVPCLGFWAV